MPLSNDLLWFKNAIFYEVHLRSFADSNGDGKGDLPGLISKLDYLSDLGVTCLWLLPMFPSPLKDDGYDIADYYSIHPDYGTLDDFKALIKEAHARNIRVITDLVLNHTSDQHPWFVESRQSKDASRRHWYVWSETDQRYNQTRIIFLDTEPSNWAYDEVSAEYYWHRFYSSQPDLNYDNPEVAEEMIRVLRFWMDLGIDGFRADAVPYLFEREGTNCENLPETHVYLKRLRQVLDQEYPGAILLGEANQWPNDLRPYFGGNLDDPEDIDTPGDEFHMAFHFPVMPRIFKAFKVAHKRDIETILAETPPIPRNTQWCIFLRNHDELTLEMVTEEDRQFMWQAYAPVPRMRLNLGIRRRLAPLLDNDRRKIEAANALLFALPGAPIIYYGDEIGMGDNIALFDRNGVRTPMQWTDEPGSGFSTGTPWAPLIDEPPYGYRQLNVAAQQKDPNSLYHFTRRLVALRRAHPVLGWGSISFLNTDNDAVLAFRRWGYTPEGEGDLLILVNLSSHTQIINLDIPTAYFKNPLRDVLSETILPPAMEIPHQLELAPFQYCWLQAQSR